MTYRSLFHAYYDARRNKRNTLSQLKFELNLERNLAELYRELRDRSYRPGSMLCFVVQQPVRREVFASSFRDRVVHHLYYNYVYPAFDRSFIHDSYSCRVGRGTLFGIERLEHHLRSATDNYRRKAWVMKLDLQGYFMSIDRRRLAEVVKAELARYWQRPQWCRQRAAKDAEEGEAWPDLPFLFYLTDVITGRDPMERCRMRGRPDEWDGLPESKTLRGNPPGVGLPIGDLTSQLFSNVYLNRLDQFVKRELHISHYGRYVDDFYCIHADKRVLLEARVRIEAFLAEMGLRLHPRKRSLHDTWRSVEFLGAVVRPFQRYVTPRTVGTFRSRRERFLQQGVMPELAGWDVSDLMSEACEATMVSYAGYFGHFRAMGLLASNCVAICEPGVWPCKFHDTVSGNGRPR